MEKIIKQAGLALASFGLVATASAATFASAPCNCEITLPDQDGGFVFSITAAWTDVALSHTDYAIVADDQTSGSGKVKDVDFDYDWGWGLDIGYIFPGTARDVRLSWVHIDLDDDSKVGNDTNGVFASLVVPSAGDTATFAKAKIDFDLDSVALEFGKRINIGTMLGLRLHGGLLWAKIDRDIKALYEDNRPAGGPVVPLQDAPALVKLQSEFNGIGPRFGADAHVPVMDSGFSIVGHVATAAVIGEASTKYRDERAIVATSTVLSTSDKEYALVPEVEAKLALAYNWDNQFLFEFGYEAVNYFNAIETLRVPTANGTILEDTSDAGYHGLYLHAAIVV